MRECPPMNLTLHDIVETIDGIIGPVTSYIHLPGEVIISPKYVLLQRTMQNMPGTIRVIHGNHYLRYNISIQGRLDPTYRKASDDIHFLQPYYPHYFKSEGDSFLTVPYHRVQKVYRGRQGVVQLLEMPENICDSIQAAAISLLKFLHENMIPLSNLGVVGSILLQLQTVGISDIDLVVYGSSAYRQAMHLLSRGYLQTLRFPGESEWRSHYTQVGIMNRLSAEEYAKLMTQQFNRGSISGVDFGILAVRNAEEIEKLKRRLSYQYSLLYENCELVGHVIDDSEIMFMYPSIFCVEIEKWISEHPRSGGTELQIFNYSAPYVGLELQGKKIYLQGDLYLHENKRRTKLCVKIWPRTGLLRIL